jgi:hypothetical protein
MAVELFAGLEILVAKTWRIVASSWSATGSASRRLLSANLQSGTYYAIATVIVDSWFTTVRHDDLSLFTYSEIAQCKQSIITRPG